jgi:hypothetical protein
VPSTKGKVFIWNEAQLIEQNETVDPQSKILSNSRKEDIYKSLYGERRS